MQSHIDAFQSEKGENGEPAHPHFERLRPQIANLLRGGAPDLKTAYEQAMWSDPELRKEMIQRESGEDIEARKVAAEKAKRAANQPRTSGGQFKASGKPRSMDDTMSDVYDRLAGA